MSKLPKWIKWLLLGQLHYAFLCGGLFFVIGFGCLLAYYVSDLAKWIICSSLIAYLIFSISLVIIGSKISSAIAKEQDKVNPLDDLFKLK